MVVRCYIGNPISNSNVNHSAKTGEKKSRLEVNGDGGGALVKESRHCGVEMFYVWNQS